MPQTPLTLQQMKNAVERRGGDIPGVPLFWHKFYNSNTVKKYGNALERLNQSVVDDCISLTSPRPGNFEAPQGAPENYYWAIEPDPGDLETQGITSRHVVSRIDLIDDFVESIPDPSDASLYAEATQLARDNPNRYCVAFDFFCLFEISWLLFGMQEILCEMALNPARMKRLLRGFTDYHKKVMTCFAQAGAHAYFASDDLGAQTSLIFSRDIFLDQYLPFYEEMIDHCHSLGMHFWLHICGAIDHLLDDFISVGLDGIHPIQPIAMDQQAIARRYRDKITFLAGIDVQYLLPSGTTEEVAAGTRKLIDTFDHEEGGCIIAAANGIMPETPLANIETWLKTAQSYGRKKRASYP